MYGNTGRRVNHERPVREPVTTAREEDATSAYGCTGIPTANSQVVELVRGRGGGCGEWVRVHWYTVSEQSGIEWPGHGGGCGESVRVH